MKNQTKSMKVIHLMWIIYLFVTVSYGQENEVETTWQLGIGYENYNMLDKNVSPLIYKANNKTVSTQLQKNKMNRNQNIGLKLSLGNSQSKRHGQRQGIIYDAFDLSGNRDSTIYDINPQISFLQAGLHYMMLWKLKPSKIPFFVGANLYERFTYSAMSADIWFFNQLSIALASRVETFVTRNSAISAGLNLPLMSYLIKQPYALDPSLSEESYLRAYINTGSSISTIDKFRQLNLTAEYLYHFKNKNAIGISWQFLWMAHSRKPDRQLKAYANSILLIYHL